MDASQDEVYAAFVEADGEGIVVARGYSGARFMLKLTPKRLYVLVDGEPSGKTMIDAFADAIATGELKSGSTLIDLTRFTGSVDWDAVRVLRDMSARGAESTASVAYVVRDKLFFKLIKIATVIFPKTRHKAFDTRVAAAAWLDASGK